jgi:TonB family protein
MRGRAHLSLGRWLIAALLLLPTPSARALEGPQEAPPGGPPYRVGGGVTRPEKISGLPPSYTDFARTARVTGVVIVEAVIDEQGNVASARVLKGLPMGLDQAAVNAVQTWKFKPATLDGRPVSVYYILTVNFQVDNPFRGPRFQALLAKNPDLQALLKQGRYEQATQLVDRWTAERPGDEDVPLASCYLLLEQGRLEEAWQGALSYRGSDPFEVLHAVGAYALGRAEHDHQLTAAARSAVIDLGLEAETMALEARADAVEAMASKVQLLRDKLQAIVDPEERQELSAELSQLQLRMKEIQPRRPPG